jgi:hypothetical protein
LKVSRQFFCLDTFGRQADEYITRGVMFFMFFYVSMFALWYIFYVMDSKGNLRFRTHIKLEYLFFWYQYPG